MTRPQRRSVALLLVLVVCAGLFARAGAARAEPNDGLPDRDPPFRYLVFDHETPFPAGSTDVTWVGHRYVANDPVGSYLAVHAGGVWDFDMDVPGTDSTQGWVARTLPERRRFEMPLIARPDWAFAWGNEVDRACTPLALDRATRSVPASFIQTGITGAWHQDDMLGVGVRGPIDGAGSAWCGLRAPGDLHRRDPLTGNPINGDLAIESGPGNEPEFPGYCNGWDQCLYKDFGAPPTGAMTFTYRTDMSLRVDPIPGGSGWFTPDPASLANLVNDARDSLMVYIGSPQDGNVYDTDHRWLTEVLDFGHPVQRVLAACGSSGGGVTVTLPYGGAPVGPLVPIGGKLRVVFRVVTNRVAADQSTADPTGFDSADGAAMIDDFSINGGPVDRFDSPSDITARSLDPLMNTGQWIATGRPPTALAHVENLDQLFYEDPCGQGPGSTSRCGMAGQVLVFGDAFNFDKLSYEVSSFIESPTIDLASHDGQHPNSQGLTSEEAARPCAVLDFDFYPGWLTPEQAAGLFVTARYHGGGAKSPRTGTPTWSNVILSPFQIGSLIPSCVHESIDLSSMGIPFGEIDSLKVGFYVESSANSFGAADYGNTRGTYIDNVRVGLVKKGALPLVAQQAWDRLQDTFPFNDGIAPGSAQFDTATAILRTSRNLDPQVSTGPVCDPCHGLAVAGDTLLAEATRSGDGVNSGVRMDLVFRIDPGPGNYTVAGDRTSPLRGQANPTSFWAQYMADPGTFSKGSHHGGTRWDPDTWNSARMDTAEENLWPVNARAIGHHDLRTWMGAYHENDPKYSTLGIVHDICFLADPDGPATDPNVVCTGTPPAAYGAVPGTTREGTKILPDGLFTPGTHIEYFVRRSRIESPADFDLCPDTSRVTPQSPWDDANLDQQRWNHVDVLPDLWKDQRFGGSGLACMLLVNACERRGSTAALRGVLDTLGYGANGASQGWRLTSFAQRDPNDPACFLPANLGQYGRSYDEFDVGSGESGGSGHLGTRILPPAPGKLAGREARPGPSEAMLAQYYGTILWNAGDVLAMAVSDPAASASSTSANLNARDETMLLDYVHAGSPAAPHHLWVSGESSLQFFTAASDLVTVGLQTSPNGLGNYRPLTLPAAAGQTVTSVIPAAPFMPAGRAFGLSHDCTTQALYFLVDASSIPGTAPTADYEALGSYPPLPGSVASLYASPTSGGLSSSVVVDGFDIAHLSGDGAAPSAPSNLALNTATDTGRRVWVDRILSSFFADCPPRGPVIAVGDIPATGAAIPYRALGAAPNPAPAAGRTRLRYAAPRNAVATLRIYDVAGRLVARRSLIGQGGEASYAWDGRDANGASVRPGVYFYRVGGAKDDTGAAAMKFVLVGGARP